MIFLIQFGINKHLYIFQRPQIALALWACAILLVFENFTPAYLFQIALENHVINYTNGVQIRFHANVTISLTNKITTAWHMTTEHRL